MKKQINQAMTFLTEAKVELKKVTWPSRKEATGGTIVVLIAVFIIGVYLGIVDVGLSELIKVLIRN